MKNVTDTTVRSWHGKIKEKKIYLQSGKEKRKNVGRVEIEDASY